MSHRHSVFQVPSWNALSQSLAIRLMEAPEGPCSVGLAILALRLSWVCSSWRLCPCWEGSLSPSLVVCARAAARPLPGGRLELPAREDLLELLECGFGVSLYLEPSGGVHFVLIRKVAQCSPFESSCFPYTYLQFLSWFSEMFYMASLTSY